MKYAPLLLALSLLFACEAPTPKSIEIVSPDQFLRAEVSIADSALSYCISAGDRLVIDTSALGFEFKNQAPLTGPFSLVNVVEKSTDEQWEQVWGEQRWIKDQHQQTTITLRETAGKKREFDLIFKVFNDGVSFRYAMPQQFGVDSVFITNELTEFNFSEDQDAWFNPAHFDSYEAAYQQKKISEIASANTPFTFGSEAAQIYGSIHEANLTDYAGMTLKKRADNPLGFEADLVPWPDGDKVKTTLPFVTPWRTIQISKNAACLAESTMILNLNEPNKIEDISWIKPTKYVGIWWGMHLGTQTWTLGARHGATTENMLRYIDFAAENNIQSVLAEGWSTGWEHWGQARAFDFVTPYEDFDLPRIAAYAKEKNIQLIGHHETGGDSEYYEEQMDSAFQLYQSLGIRQLKTGYAGPIVPRGQFHHGQYMVNHYRRVVEMAAKYHITINAHEPIKPTGIRRTYPNMMAREGARGMEWNAWSDGNAPDHHTIVPFTRILGGPFDYTPGIFDLLYANAGERVKWNGLDKGTSRTNTTLAKQLALYVVFYSPLQMASDLIENYEDQPAFQFIRDVPVNWEETRVLQASIGNCVAMARKDWDSDDWYLGALTNAEGRVQEIGLDFLDKNKKYRAEIYRDATDADWKDNPQAHEIVTEEVTSMKNLTLVLAPGGGQAIRFKALN